ncbi:DUF7594 domain-containing protein [Flexithrix dorotheae]|uniref:CBM96 family carbohydrate-binding protein n=1 Tax=Flexithrix dorotheae TaxID=70993 RepID=UPI0003A19C6D|nr:DNRLRE domain-containing protein [Flexithrix dorotheae]
MKMKYYTPYPGEVPLWIYPTFKLCCVFFLLIIIGRNANAQTIYLENGEMKSTPYSYPGLDAGTKAQLDAIKNLPTTTAQENLFWKQVGKEVNKQVSTGGNFGGRFFENEKSSYPKAMSTIIHGAAHNIPSYVTSGADFLMEPDNQGGSMASYTRQVDLYPSFTLKGQIPKYFYFGKLRGDVTASYLEDMRKGIFLWTHKYWEENGSTNDPVLPTPILGDPINNNYTERSPFYRANPVYSGASGWGPDAKNSWVDIRGTDNLRSMRETSIYLLSKEMGYNSVASAELNGKITNHVATLYNVGYSEWESDTYYPHVIAPYLNLYAYAPEVKAKELAKAALDWYLLAGAAKYFRGSQIPPSKRVYEERFVKVGSSEAGQVGLRFFGGVPDTYSIPAKVSDKDAFISFLSGYRPPQAVYGIGTKDMQKHVEVLGTKNTYGQFNVNQSAPEAREFVYYGDHYIMASAAYSGSNGDMADNGMSHFSSSIGSEGFLVYRPNGDGTINFSKQYRHQIGQYRNIRIHLQPASQNAFYILTASERSGVQTPVVETDNAGNQVMFFEYENSWVSVRLVNGVYSSSVAHDESTGAKYGGWWTTDENDNKDVHVHKTNNTSSSGYAGFIIEIGELGSRTDQFPSFSAFKTDIKNRTPDLSNIGSGEVSLSTKRGISESTGEFVKMQLNNSNDFPILYRNSQIPYNWYDDTHNYDTYRSITPPLAQLDNVSAINSGSGVRIEATAYDPELGPITQAWKSGKLTVISGAAGTASGYKFESSIDGAGNVTSTETAITSVAQRRGELAKVEIWVDNIRIADITSGADLADLENGSFVYEWLNAKNGTNMEVKLRAEDLQGNVAWSNIGTVTVTNGDNVAPNTPANVVVNPISAEEIQLDWDDNGASDFLGFNVYRSTTENFTISPGNLIAERLTVSEFNDAGLAAGQPYFYKITAIDGAFNESAPTASISGSTLDLTSFFLSEDAHVDAGATTTNYGSNSILQIKGGGGAIRRAFMKIDLSTFDKVPVTAVLRMKGRRGGGETKVIPIGIMECTESWSESTITWDNAPNIDTRYGGPVLALDTLTTDSWAWYAFDISDHVKAAILAGQTELNLAIGSRTWKNGVPNEFYSSEAGSTNRPYLEIAHIDGDDVAPATVSGVTVVETTGVSATLQWNAVPDVDLYGYYIYRSTSSGFTPSSGNLIATGITDLSYTDNDLAGNTTYYYKITAKDLSANESVPSAEIAVSTFSSNLYTPVADAWVDANNPDTNYGTATSLVHRANGELYESYMRFDVSDFSQKIIENVKLRVYARVSEGNETIPFGVFHLPYESSPWQENSITYNLRTNVNTRNTGEALGIMQINGVAYKWYEVDITSYVRREIFAGSGAIDLIFGNTAISDKQVHVSSKETGNAAELVISYTNGDATSPAAPTGLSATAGADGGIEISWDYGSDADLAVYRVHRSATAGFTPGDANWIQNVNAANTTFADSEINSGGTYYYQIAAVDSSGNVSGYSNEASATANGSVFLEVLEDAYIHQSNPTTNYGSEANLYVKRIDGSHREAYIKVALSSITNSITSAKLRYYGKLGDNTQSNIPAGIYEVSATGWSENSLTFENSPTKEANEITSTTIIDENYQWYEWDISNYIKIQKALGSDTLAFVIANLTTSSPFAIFNSREAADNTPELEVVISNLPTTEIPQFNLVSGDYIGDQQITITAADADEIRYTLDGTEPSESNGTVYSGSITLSNSVTLKAKAFKAGHLPSATRIGVYNITPQSCAIPINLKVENLANNGATLKWSLNAGTETPIGYEISYREEGTTNWTVLGAGGTHDSTSIEISGLQETTTYEWKVNVFCSNGSESWATSGEVDGPEFTTYTSCNIIPVNLSASNLLSCSAEIQWDAIVGVTNYQVRYRKVGTSTWNDRIAGNSTYKIYNLDASSNYEWQVRTYCEGTETNSDYSSTDNFNTGAAGDNCISFPSDNPFAVVYPATPGNHWTNNLAWSNVFNVEDYGVVAGGDMATNGSSNFTNIVNAVDAANAAGGGVVFFPSGTYYIDPGTSEDGIELKEGVILRGETPAITDATNASFAPPSRLEFPEYIFNDSGNGTPNNTAFKRIYSFDGADNIGVVYLDINRAHIYCWAPLENKPGYSTRQPATEKENMIFFGTRTNNAARPFSNIPESFQHQWQRLPNAYAGANISALGTKNILIANNRMNDAITDNHTFSSYIIQNANNTSQTFSLENNGTDDRRVSFRHSDQYGIVVNRNKGDYVWGATEDTEILSFVEGVEILGNWMFKTNRVGIHAAGKGMVIKNNVINDQDNKFRFASSNGYQSPRTDQTFENRGIDWAGHNVTIEGNQIEVYNDYFENVFTGQEQHSVDGEGILLQECCGGTTVDGAIIRNNVLSGQDPMIGIWKAGDIRNVEISGNDLGGVGIITVMSNKSTDNSFWGVFDLNISNNININTGGGSPMTRGLKVIASKGGSNVVVQNNAAVNGGTELLVPCFAQVSGNTNFTVQDCIASPYPKISNFSPATSCEGGTVTLNGSGFENVETVFVGTLPANNVSVNNSNQLTFEVPVGAVNGKIKIKVAGTENPQSGYTPAIPSSSDVSTATLVIEAACPKEDQTITFNSLAAKTFGNADFDLNASSSSGLPITYSSSDETVATISGNTVTIVGAGSTDITASQPGNISYNPAADVVQNLVVNKASQTITFDAISDKTVGDPDFNLTASASSGLAVTFSVVSGPASVSGNTVSLTGSAGTVTIRASHAGDDNYEAATDEDQSFQVQEIAGGGLPSPWLNADIGNVAATGDASYSSGTFTLDGSGKDIWGNTDEFQFVYQSLNGDGEIVAQVNSLTNTNAWAKAGVMIRESLNGNSKHAMSVITSANGVSFQRRTGTGSSSSSTKIAGISAPIWVKINRTGNVFTSSYSNDGSNWTEIGNVTISMSANTFVGLCLTSHNDGTIATATYDNVALNNNSQPQTQTFNTTVNQEVNGGQWNSVGTFSIDGGTQVSVTIRTDNTNGYVIVDAVQLTKSGQSDIILDNSDASGVTTTGSWTTSSHTSGYHGANYLHDGNTGKGSKTITYTTTVPSTGDYTISLRWTSHSNRADNVPVEITYTSGGGSGSRFSASPMITEQLEDKPYELTVFPNPASQFLDLQIDGKEGDWKVKIFDLNGKIYLQEIGNQMPGASTIRLDVSQFPTGLYLMEFIMAEEKQMQKIMILK